MRNATHPGLTTPQPYGPPPPFWTPPPAKEVAFTAPCPTCGALTEWTQHLNGPTHIPCCAPEEEATP